MALLACLGKPNTSSTNILKIRGGCRRIQQLFYSALQGHCVSVLLPERAPTNPPRLEAFKTAALQRSRAIATRPCRVARIQNALYVYVRVRSVHDLWSADQFLWLFYLRCSHIAFRDFSRINMLPSTFLLFGKFARRAINSIRSVIRNLIRSHSIRLDSNVRLYVMFEFEVGPSIARWSW